jgi:hypothetical protein
MARLSWLSSQVSDLLTTAALDRCEVTESNKKMPSHGHQLSYNCLCVGVGTRDYYRKLGYRLEGPYMVKSLVSEDDSMLPCDLDLLD